ncbi:MAG: GNVR domain-containing protein [Nitrospirota bacterium]
MSVFRNNKWWFFVPFFSVLLLTLALIFLLPKRYQSTTLILVQEGEIDLTNTYALGSEPVSSQLSTLSQQILNRSSLQKIVDQFGLYKNLTTIKEMQVEKMREDTKIETVGLNHLNAFSISYLNENPTVAMRVTAALANYFIEETSQRKQQQADGVTGLLTGELEKIKKNLEEQENKIKTFELQYYDELPEQMEANLRKLDRLQIDLRLAKEAKAADETAVKTIPRREKLTTLKRELLILQGRLKDSHPNIRELKREIQALEELPLTHERKQKTSLASNQDQESLIVKDMAWFIAREKQIRLKIRTLEEHIDRTPLREQKRSDLQREYSRIRENYHVLLERNPNLEILKGTNTKQDSQFRIIDPAHFPIRPIQPNPIQIGFFGLLFGLAIGFGFLWFRSSPDRSIYQPEELERVIPQIPVFAAILDYEEARSNRTIFAPRLFPGLDPEKQIQRLVLPSSWEDVDTIKKQEVSRQHVWTKIG